MRNEGVGSWATRRARMSPRRVALVHDGREWTYAAVAGGDPAHVAGLGQVDGQGEGRFQG